MGKYGRGERFGNARYVRILFERAIEMQALRLMVSGQRSLDHVLCLKLEDFCEWDQGDCELETCGRRSGYTFSEPAASSALVFRRTTLLRFF